MVDCCVFYDKLQINSLKLQKTVKLSQPNYNLF